MSTAQQAQRTVARALTLAQRLFARRGIDNPPLSAQLLLAETLRMGRVQVLLERKRLLSTQEWKDFWKLAARRSLGEPVAYIMGRKEFYGREFAVNNRVLTPRPETEHLVEAALERFAGRRPPRFADLGTGSGILAVTLALELPGSSAVALDISAEALTTARCNASLHLGEEAGRLLFCQADFAEAPLALESLDLVVSNPPYVGAREYQGLSREITGFEPRHALVPLQENGQSGLESIACVLQTARCSLAPGGWLLMEIGCQQRDAVLRLADKAVWRECRVLPDLAGLPRVFAGQLDRA